MGPSRWLTGGVHLLGMRQRPFRVGSDGGPRRPRALEATPLTGPLRHVIVSENECPHTVEDRSVPHGQPPRIHAWRSSCRRAGTGAGFSI